VSVVNEGNCVVKSEDNESGQWTVNLQSGGGTGYVHVTVNAQGVTGTQDSPFDPSKTYTVTVTENV
jgi:hypothetical protein